MGSETIPRGTVQTNYILSTSQGKYVYRFYENRARESVLFECELLVYLCEHDYPCPPPILNIHGSHVGTYHNKPHILFPFIVGEHIEQPRAHHWQQLIQRAAQLHQLTRLFASSHTPSRLNYNPESCYKIAQQKAGEIGTDDAREKSAWLAQELAELRLPPELRRGICHGDFHFSNVLFHHDELVALLDFDDANHTFLMFDLVGLIEYWAWPHTAESLDLKKARWVVREYSRHFPLSHIERRHLFDVYAFSILFDCLWYFDRGTATGCYERRKIENLKALGRQRFFEELK